MAREEALALHGGVRFINQHLMTVLPGNRTLEAIKGARRGAAYRALVEAAQDDLRAVPEVVDEEPADASAAASTPDGSESDSSSSSSFRSASSVVSPRSGVAGPSSPQSSPLSSSRLSDSSRWSALYSSFSSAIRRLMPIVGCIQGFASPFLVELGLRLLNGEEVTDGCCTWLKEVFPPPPPRRPLRRPARGNSVPMSRKRRRRREYAHVQRLFKTHMSRAAKEILDGPVESRIPDVAAMAAHWGPFVAQESTPVPQGLGTQQRPDLQYVWHPVTCEDTEAVTVSLSSASGIDGVTARQWRAVPASVKALFFNIVLASGGFPAELLISRTVFVPKKVGGADPADFRPISIASVTVRHLHKILAQRIGGAGLVDIRQRCLDDGCAENITVLASLLEDSRRRLRELHITSLDVAKAFDSVSHDAISSVLGRSGLPLGFRQYVQQLYTRSYTMFEVEGVRSEQFRVQRGVRQGDPLSTILFCLVVDEALSSVPRDVGYEIEGCHVNALAFADDILLISSTVSGMEQSLRRVEARMHEQGLLFNANKCVALSIVPSGKQKKYKVLTVPQFHLGDGSAIPQLSPSQEWRYLGVDFRPIGPKRAGGTINNELDRLTRAPLKPQQRLKILRVFLVPRFYHKLVLSGTTLGKLRALDVQVRGALRKWLRLPHDSPVGYFHTPCSMGGLGIPSFATTVPTLMLARLGRLASSPLPAARAAAESEWVRKRLTWAERALTKDGRVLRSVDQAAKWWADHLYRAVDGRELRECGRSNLSAWWIDGGSYGVPGRDYVQYHHVRVNSLPTRVRTSRGVRRTTMDVQCRAGCRVTETAAHVIQACHRTHGGRVKRHNAVCKVITSGLRNDGWAVTEEPRFHTSSGVRKPDIVAHRGGCVSVIDAQVVSGATSLDDSHERKVAYYRDNKDVLNAVIERYGVRPDSVSFSSCTLSWRGIWSSKSADYLLGLGLPKRLLAGITTRVLQGSHTNWIRWNKMTGTVLSGEGLGHPRVGVG